jgi:hypothetical protein
MVCYEIVLLLMFLMTYGLLEANLMFLGQCLRCWTYSCTFVY